MIDVPVKSIASNRDFGEKFGVKFGDILNHEGVSEGISEGVKARLEKELLYLKEHKRVRRIKMERIFEISTATAERDLALLRRLKLIVFEGAPKTGMYVLTEKGKNLLSDASKL
ncbi:MAG: hypothetical protein JSW00_06965 [Thermoplasmata archaeon]|nr:MAG: hypothetical protein JSW00_06965 [Thermoplasmata archaeon]